MVTKLIIVDGMDNTGKSTLIARLTKVLESLSNTTITIHSQKPPKDIAPEDTSAYQHKYYLDLINMLATLKSERKYDYIILDRGWISEYVYGPLYRNRGKQEIVEDNIVLDGELTIYDFMNYPSDQVYKATMKIISSKEPNKKGITLNAFDILTYDEWCNGCETIQKDRKHHLEKLLAKNKSKSLFCVPTLYIGKDPSKIGELMKTIVEPNNYEGLVLKDTNEPYLHKRCKSWLKVKQMETYDLRVIDTFEGENSLKGKLGGFVAEITLPDGKFVHTKIGNGFSLVERSDLWLIKDSLIGKAIEVQGFELTTNNKSDFYSIRFPVFKDFIEEGKELNGDYKGI